MRLQKFEKREGREKSLLWIWLYTKEGHVKRNCPPSHTHVLRTVLLNQQSNPLMEKHWMKLFSWVFKFSAELCTVLEPSRLSLTGCCAPQLAAGSNKRSRDLAAESKMQLPASLRLHRYAICPDWNHLGCIRLGNLSSLLAYLLFIQGKCCCDKSYTLDCTDKIVCQNLGWSLLSQY